MIRLFERRGWQYFVDSCGDLGGIWDDATFYFLVSGDHDDILSVRGTYPGRISASHLEAVCETLEESHRRCPIPRACYSMDDGGGIRVHAEHTVHYESGPTDAQFLDHVDVAIMFVSELFAQLDRVLGR